MDIQAYISSGIIESYVLGMATPKERAEFERLCKQYPELQEARNNFEISLEKEAFLNAVEPPPFLKEKVIDTIKYEKTFTTGKVASIGSPRMRWAVAASIILLLGCSIFVYVLYNKNQALKRDLATTNDTISKLDEKRKSLQNQVTPPNNLGKEVKLYDKKRNVVTAMNVYWDSTANHVYLVIKDLEHLPEPQHYHLWAVIKGEHKSIGTFNTAENNDKLILRLVDVKNADAFAITIEDSVDVKEPKLETVDPNSKF